jgi:hypothetical protein
MTSNSNWKETIKNLTGFKGGVGMARNRANLITVLGLILALLQSTSFTVKAGNLAHSHSGSYQCGRHDSPDAFEDEGEVLPIQTANPQLQANMRADATELRRLFGVTAGVMFLNEAGGPNAYAVMQSQIPARVLEQFRLTPSVDADGMVFMGVKLLEKERNSGMRTGYSIPSIMAHEFDHILQYKLGFPFSGKWLELHADFMAGWYTAHRVRFAPQNIDESMLSFYSNGDYDFNNPDHHGTPEERLAAFRAGMCVNFCQNVSNARLAYSLGINYLSTLNAQ